jgi:hypothetical protein
VGGIENRNSSDVVFHFALGWRFMPDGSVAKP